MQVRLLKSERGMAILIALIMVGLLTLIGLAALSTSDDEVSIAGNELQETRGFYAAEAGLEQAAADIQHQYESTGAPPTNMPSGTLDMNNCSVVYGTIDDGAPTRRMLTSGTLAGLHALVKSFSISSVADNNIDRARVEISQSFETALVPIFQFAVFYGNDLEIAPGPNMTLTGRVHTNGNLWLQAGSGLNIDSYVTAARNIFHGRKGAGGVSTGDVSIKNAAGSYVSMQDGADWLDANDADWFNESLTRWTGRVQDSTHGQPELNLPLASADDPHKIIEPAAGNPDSYELKSTLKYINGSWYAKQGGLWQDVTGGMAAAGIINSSPDQFYDGREQVGVDVVELDMDKLNGSLYAPPNGVIYFSDDPGGTPSDDFPALRIVNGDELEQPLTIASENPVYTLGDYNSVNKKPAAILTDALTFLSGNFDDSKTDPLAGWTKDDRSAQQTTVNCSYLTGNVETTASDYNGGFENLPRFLENWGGVTFKWAGSAVNLWYSQQADGTWNGTYYTPPDRDWSYDTDLDDPNKLPPETPVVRVFQRTGWQLAHVGY